MKDCSRYGISPRSLPKQKFTEADDQKLISVVNQIGTKNWQEVAQMMGDRNARQCKERWENYLSPDINRDPWTQEEDDLLIEKQKEIGSRWVTIAKFFNHRTDAAVKNRFQMLERKQRKLEKKGITITRKQKVHYESPNLEIKLKEVQVQQEQPHIILKEIPMQQNVEFIEDPQFSMFESYEDEFSDPYHGVDDLWTFDIQAF